MMSDANKAAGQGRDLRILTVCPLCQAQYNPLKTQVMAERDDAHLLYLQCRQCGSAVMAVVTNDANGLSTVGAVTDLQSDEVLPAQEREPMSDDDVIALHAWLQATADRLPGLASFSSRST